MKAGKECYHCHQVVAEKDRKTHDCWTTTPEKLTADLSEDLRDAWDRVRESAESFGEQRVYASHKSIMFARTTCYFFVRPKKKVLEVCFFLGREQENPLVRRRDRVSKKKVAHLVHVKHRDEVEAPLTDWLREAYDVSETLRIARPAKAPRTKAKKRA